MRHPLLSATFLFEAFRGARCLITVSQSVTGTPRYTPSCLAASPLRGGFIFSGLNRPLFTYILLLYVGVRDFVFSQNDDKPAVSVGDVEDAAVAGRNVLYLSPCYAVC